MVVELGFFKNDVSGYAVGGGQRVEGLRPAARKLQFHIPKLKSPSLISQGFLQRRGLGHCKLQGMARAESRIPGLQRCQAYLPSE